MNKAFIFWAAFGLLDLLFIFVLIFTKFNFIIAGFGLLVLGLVSLAGILVMKELALKVKWGMALGFPFKYFILGFFAFLIPYFGASATPAYVLGGLYFASIIGSQIALRLAIKSQKLDGLSAK